ncbi:hypothetical protein [Parasitella parasitica]|uniref:Importin N-terminal domain-containing protein n=1 Tax=Parasitella parasitica TaxID=35722 RepID=A0A0B7NJG7_9FUNG|nr:hypothetical protein [Parasitella parasitica]
MSTEATASVLKALSTLYGTIDRQSNREASRWLEAFQKKPEAWAVADYLMKMPETESSVGTRLFAAQTFKQKITYDLRELRTEARIELRDSLLELLWQSSNGPKAVMIQLCLAITDLAIQLFQWKTVIPDLIDKFGKSDHGSVCLLEILKVLPEEMNGNTRLPLTESEYKLRGEELIDNNAKRVLDLLTMYMQSSGNNTELQERIFKCLSSWIRTGEIDIDLISTSPLLQLSFKSLESPELFDVAVDVVTEIIYETRDVNECRPIIEQIYPCFASLLQKLTVAIEEEDEDAVRGYGRIFVEAGEAYITLIGSHPEAFEILMDGLIKVSAYKELDIVPITFKFWYELTNLLETETFKASIPRFLRYYDALVDVMIGHLRYPADFDSLTAEENDNFRDFRHEMGDTLKDCCRILTPQRCLVKPMNLLALLLNDPLATWQQIEAPIFALRVMGSEVPKNENEVMPHIMEFLSKLPDHPKIRYAATLVISRYSFWTEAHPQFIEYQLNFISNGMQNTEVAAASALALKHLCKDCNKHLVNYLVQLQSFYVQVTKSLPFRDILEVTEAVSHVISVIPPAEIQKALQNFCLPVAQELHDIISRAKDKVTDEDCVKIGDILEQISVFFDVIRPDIPVGQPHPCITFITELWPVLDATLTNFGQVVTVSEPLCKCFNSFIVSYGPHFIPLLPQLIERIVNVFAITGLSGYLWVSLKLIRGYARDNEGPCFDFIRRLSQAMFIKMQRQPINDIPDVIEEYFRLITAFLENAPGPLLQDPLLETIFQAGVAGLSITEPHALGAILAFYRKLLELSDKSTSIAVLLKQFGGNLTAVLLNGSIDFYNQDFIPDVATFFKSVAEILPQESSDWMMTVINAVPEDFMPMETKTDFIANWTSAINGQHWIKVRRIFSDFVATYRRRNASKPVIPSLAKISDLTDARMPVPFEKSIPKACQDTNFQWLASDRTYWDGWASKSFFMKKNGRFTRKNVQIGQDESICVAVLLGPIPAVSTIRHMPHYAPADSITMLAKSESTGAVIPIVLQQHDKQSNAYFASVKFTQHGVWILDTSVEYRSYFWEQPGTHQYRPNRFISRNSLTVYKKLGEKSGTEDPSTACDFTEPFTLQNSVWIKKDYAQDLQHVKFEAANFIFNPSCQFDIDKTRFRSKLTIHMWGDHHLERNLQHLIGDRPATDMCNVEQRAYNVDSPIVHDMAEIHFGKIDTNIVDSHLHWKIDMQGISRRLPKADVVILGVGNLDLENMRQHPNDFAKVFMSFLNYVIQDVYPDQRIIVKSTQYFNGHSKGLNYGRSEAYANIIRSAIASLSEQDKQRVILWDTHQLGFKENQCEGSLTSHSQIVDIENAILSHLFM